MTDEVAGVEFAGLENDRLENDGLEIDGLESGQELIRRWDSERELVNDDIAHT